MSAVPFDTLAYAKKLEARGVQTQQAEAHAEVLAEVLEASFTTKSESTISNNNVSQEIRSLHHELKAEIASVKAEVIKWMFGVSVAQAALILSVLKFFH